MKRLVLLLGVLLIFCTPGYSAYTLIASTSATAVLFDGPATTGPINTTGATLIVVMQSQNDLFSPLLSDSASNSWTNAFTQSGGVGVIRQVWSYTVNPTTSTTHTFTADSTNCVSACYTTIFVQAFSGGTAGSPVDVAVGSSGTAITSLSTGSGTPSENNELIMSGFTCGGNSTVPSVDSGMTLIASKPFADDGMGHTLTVCSATAYKVQTTAAAINPNWTTTLATTLTTAMVTFKLSAASNPSGSHLFRIMGVGQ